ncbi:MAG: hypothetical protein JKY88_09000 [Pseudomonadales bacterium]|nr:hypothetical protein [Pseudomonadales bacterium]
MKPANDLAIRLFIRDIKAQYRQSVLGIIWVIIPPLLTAGLWIFLNNSNIINVGETTIPYPLFVMIGTMLWQIFVESVNQPLANVRASRGMLTKINFPREALLLSGFYTVIFNLLPKLLVLAIAFSAFGLELSGSLFLFPLGILSICLFGFAIGILLTPPGLLLTDVPRAIAVILPFAMYMTPVIYPPPTSGLIATLMQFNPLAILIETSRNWFSGQLSEIPIEFTILGIITMIVLVISTSIYRISMPIVIERFGG